MNAPWKPGTPGNRGRSTAEEANPSDREARSLLGKLGRETISALMNEIAAQSRGAAADNMSLLSGLISNAQDNLAKFYRMVAENGALTWLKNQLAPTSG